MKACAFASGAAGFTTAEFDRLFFGEALPDRNIDPRIRRAASNLNDFSGSKLTAADCAASVNLSPSRFLHLFKAQTGISFRAFRAWKRARHLLHFVNEDINLAHLAQDIGYPQFDAFQPFDPPLLRPAAARNFFRLTGSGDLPQRSGRARQRRLPPGAAVTIFTLPLEGRVKETRRLEFHMRQPCV